MFTYLNEDVHSHVQNNYMIHLKIRMVFARYIAKITWKRFIVRHFKAILKDGKKNSTTENLISSAWHVANAIRWTPNPVKKHCEFSNFQLHSVGTKSLFNSIWNGHRFITTAISSFIEIISQYLWYLVVNGGESFATHFLSRFCVRCSMLRSRNLFRHGGFVWCHQFVMSANPSLVNHFWKAPNQPAFSHSRSNFVYEC